MALDLEGICASSGSACMVGSVRASHVLLAMGLPMERARSAIRLSLGKWTTAEKSPLLVMPLTESRSEPRTPANMPLLRQLEFEFVAQTSFVGPPGVSPGELITNRQARCLPATQPRRLCY